MHGRNFPEQQVKKKYKCTEANCHTMELQETVHQSSEFLNEMGKIADDFSIWITCLDGGLRHTITANKHLTNVKFVISELKPTDIESLSNQKAPYKYIDRNINDQTWKASTGKLYLISLEQFLNYVLNESAYPLSINEKSSLMGLLKKIPF